MSVLLILTAPRNKIREAFVIFSFKQMETWFLGKIVAFIFRIYGNRSVYCIAFISLF
jgi:hypothetical protein